MMSQTHEASSEDAKKIEELLPKIRAAVRELLGEHKLNYEVSVLQLRKQTVGAESVGLESTCKCVLTPAGIVCNCA
jgi:hypothetical protein